ncbi:MAG: MerR family transcriptional regulator [Polyangiaceae bacterium]|nr:MerR family transcriptional regulator [Polyangiaceae bacterium]
MRQPRALKISALARESGVPVATVKHYLREGLLPEPVSRTGRNMSWYDPACVERIRVIKRLQQERFLPLKLIKEVLDKVGDDADDLTLGAAISSHVERSSPHTPRTRAELLASGVAPGELDWLKSTGLVTPDGHGDGETYRGDDLAILRVLGAARRVGLKAEMLPTSILADYARAIRELVRTELGIFRAGVIPLAGDRLSELADHSATLSEQLIVLVRRKMLLPVLQQLLDEARHARGEGKPKSGSSRPARKKAGSPPQRRKSG